VLDRYWLLVLMANTTDIKGVIALHIALKYNFSAVAQLLLEHGATAVMNSVVAIHCCNRPHCCTALTALMLCATANTVKVLLAAGADVHAADVATLACTRQQCMAMQHQ
jgi:ankyrin repeat protein